MQLTNKASKGLAVGLAASTILMTAVAGFIPAAFAAPHAEGCNVLSNGTVYYVLGGQLRGFPSPEVFFSWGNGFGGVQQATAEDLALPMGPVMVYADGTLVKGPNDPLVYLVANGQKRGFTTGDVFTGLGFKFSNIQSAPANTFADLPTGANLDSATERHTAGVWVIDSTGTVWRMTATGRVGLPTMAVFNSWGKSFDTVVPANAADLAAPNEGVATAKPSCSGGSTPSGSLSVSVSGPASSTLVTGQTAADLADFVFNGSGTVTSVTFERIGVSSNDTLEHVYLFDGAARLTDASTVGSDNKVTFSGASLFSAPRTISVRSDIKAGSQGQTVGIRLVSYTVSGASATTVSVSGNIHSVASATLATGTFGAVSSVGDNTDPGNDLNLWQATLTANTRDVTMNRISFRKIGSIENSDLSNLRLQIAGTTVATGSAFDSNGYVTFSFSPVTITTSGKSVRLIGNVLGGAGRTFLFQLQNTTDIGLTDSSYNVGTTITNAVPLASATGESTVNAGDMTAVRATDAPSGDVTKGSNDVVVGKYTLTATGGEAVKVDTLNVGFDTSLTDADVTFRNVRILVNGLQVGSTLSVPAEDFATVVETGTQFSTNFTVNPGSPATVEVRADMFDNEGADDLANGTTLTSYLILGSNNATKVESGTTINVPSGANLAGTSGALTVKVGSMSLTKQANYTDQTTTVPQTAYKLAAFNLTGSSAEDVNVQEMTVAFNVADADTFGSNDLTGVYVKYGSNTSSTRSTVGDTGNVYSTPFTLAKNSVVPVEIYANIGSTITAGDNINATLVISGTTASGTSINTGAAVSGQVVTTGSGSISAAVSASSPVKALLSSNSSKEAARYEFSAVNSVFTVQEVTVALDADGDGTPGEAAQDLPTALMTLTLGGQTLPAAPTVTFTGLNISVPANGLTEVPVTVQVGNIGSGAGASGQKVTVRMTGYKHNSQAGTTTVTGLTLDGNPMYAYKAVPVVANDSSISTTLANGNEVLSKFTIGSQGGTIGWKKIIFTVSKAANPVVTNATVWDVTTNTQVTGTATLTTVGATNTSGSIAFVADNEQQISSNHTYELRADVGSSGTGDSISTRIAMPSGHVAPDTYANASGANGGGTGIVASLVWTDRSATSHGTGTSDWNNDYSVNTLPTTLQTLSR